MLKTAHNQYISHDKRNMLKWDKKLLCKYLFCYNLTQGALRICKIMSNRPALVFISATYDTLRLFVLKNNIFLLNHTLLKNVNKNGAVHGNAFIHPWNVFNF